MASNLRVDSIVPATGSSVSIGTATGGVNIPGVLTYEDVTNVDSVGVITARSGIRIGATGANTLITGNGTGIGIGITTPTEELHIRATTPVIRLEDGDNARQSQIVGSDGNLRLDADNNNAIADTNIAFRTDGGERLRIGPVGQIGIAGANYGTSGQVLTSQGASSPIQWATLTTGKVLQMTYKRGGVTSSSNSGGWTDSVESGLNVDITPLSATSRIIIQMHSVGGNTSSGRSYFLRLRRKVNNTGDTNVASFQIGDGSNGGMQSLALTHVDYDASSPFNTSHVRNYRIRFGQDGSGTARFDYATTSVLYCLEIQ